jgi:signal transduction histidine kinase
MAFAERACDHMECSQAINDIFEHFFRGQNAVNIKGTGLGLCIVQQYVKILKGSIDFQSVPGEGTIFTLSLGGVE